MSASCTWRRPTPARTSSPTTSRAILDASQIPDLEAARLAIAPVPTAPPCITIPAPDLKAYDRLIAAAPRPQIPP